MRLLRNDELRFLGYQNLSRGPVALSRDSNLPEPVPAWMEDSMIFIITAEGEHGPVSTSGETAAATLQRARRLADEGARNVLIDADGQEYAPAEFERLFVQPGPVEM